MSSRKNMLQRGLHNNSQSYNRNKILLKLYIGNMSNYLEKTKLKPLKVRLYMKLVFS